MADADKFLRNLLEKIAHEQKYENSQIELKKLANEGANFSSFLYEVTISGKDKDDLKLFAKVAAVGAALRAQAPMKMFEVEAYFYQTLLKKYEKLQEDHNVEEKYRLVTPKCYGVHTTEFEETIVLEDLRCKGFTTLDRFELFTWEYASQAISELAKLHALSFAYAKEDPGSFAKDLDKLKFEFPMSMEAMQHMFGGFMQNALAMANEENKAKFSKYASELSFEELFTKYYTQSKNMMLKHGDYRASNLMHRDNEDGSLTVIPIDYQTVQAGDMLTDLFYLLFSGTDQQFRADNWSKLLDFYYQELSEAMKRLGVDPETTYSREAYQENVKEMLPYGLVVALTILPIVTVEQAPEVSTDNDITTFMDMKHGEVYQKRLNGILSDFINWGIL